MNFTNSVTSNSSGQGNYLSRIVVKKDNTYHIIKITDVIYIEAAGNYINIVTDSNKYLFRNTLSGTIKRLNPNNFIQIHRSTVVNIDYVNKIKENAYGDCTVLMNNGKELSMSRNYKGLLNSF